ncbi:Dihydrolipoamide acetyltransferase component of pyruvate dehydrogenase complex [gamma proteobacterium IMCC2047]|nr:Dihydrolipoamide acetyltransferase component of pyruvate dehydrogenase complex [gamma proteobacterium IMCC2047]
MRLMARELGVDLTLVSASGPKSRILKEDVQAYVHKTLTERETGAAGSAIPAVPEVDFSVFGEIDEQPLSRVQKLTADAMQRSWLTVPHVTHFDEADITDLEEFRALNKDKAQQQKLKLTPLPFLLKACAVALCEHPQFNVSLSASGESLINKKYCHIGIAMDTPAGLMVPVIRDVDKKSIWDLAKEVSAFGIKGKEGKLSKADLEGGCFTISSLGAIGGTGFTPIVNTPEVAILGVSKTQIKPVYIDDIFQPRNMLPLTLSYDHRAVNGVDAGQFMTCLTGMLRDIRQLLM